MSEATPEATAKCCCECAACRIFYDSFTRVDMTGTGSGTGSTTIGEAWDEVLGNWIVTDNFFQISESNAIALVIDPSHATPYVWSVKFRGSDYADEPRLLVGVSGDTYLYVQVRFLQSTTGTGSGSGTGSNPNCGEVAIYNSLGQRLNAIYVPGLTLDEWHTLRVCLSFLDPAPDEYEYGVQEGRIAALVITSDGKVTRSISYTHVDLIYDNSQVGLGTGNVVGAVGFDDACWQRMGTTEDRIIEVPATRTGTGSGSGTGTATITAEPDCPTCQYREGCDWGNLYVEKIQENPLILRIPCDWQVVLGDPTLWVPVAQFYGEVICSDSESILKFMSPTPDDGIRQRLTGAVKGTTEGSQAVFHLNYTESIGSMSARVTFNDTCGKLELLFNGFVINEMNIEPLVINQWHFMCVSYDGEDLRADVGPLAETLHDMITLAYRHIGGSTSEETGTGVQVTPSPYVAIGVGNNTGVVSFKNVTASFPYHPVHFPDCFTCDNCNLSKQAYLADATIQCEWNPVTGLISDTGRTLTLSGANSLAAYEGNNGSDNGYAEWAFVAKQDGQILRTYINAEMDGGVPSGPWAQITVNEIGNSPLLLSTGQTKITAARPNTGHNMRICLDGTAIRVNYDVNLRFVPPLSASTFGTLGSPATGKYLVHQILGSGGQAEFTDTLYGKLRVVRPLLYPHEPVTCYRCYSICECCLNDLSPAAFTAELQNFKTPGPGYGSTHEECCRDSNGIYFLEGGDCGWRFDSENDPPFPGYWNSCPVYITVNFTCGPSTVTIEASVGTRHWFGFPPGFQPQPSTAHVFRKTINKPLDCMAINGLELPFIGIIAPSNSICTPWVPVPGDPPTTIYPDPPRFILSV